MSFEIRQARSDVDEIWLPVGGGGLAAGSVLAALDPDSNKPRVQVVGAEPALAGEAKVALQVHKRQPPMPPMSIADGLRASLGELNFQILDEYQLPVHLVGEAEILQVQALAMSCLKLVVEPSSAVPLAALLQHGPWRSGARCIVVILTGGNVQLGI